MIIIQIIEKLFTIAFAIVGWLFQGLLTFLLGEEKKEGYNAEFGSTGELLSSNNKGFRLTGKKSLTIKDSRQNCLVIGGTGVGKSVTILIPSVFAMEGSLVVHDPSGELHQRTAGYLHDRGYEVKVLNYANPEISDGYNPILRAKSSSDINKVASLIVKKALGDSKSDVFWESQATSFIAIFIAILKTQDVRYQNLLNVKYLLNTFNASPEKLDELFSRHADEELFSEWKTINAYEGKVLSNIVATCRSALQLFGDDAVAKVTSFDTIDMHAFREKKTALFIQNSIADQEYYSPITSLFFEQFWGELMSHLPRQEYQDVWFLIDESSSLMLPTLPITIANIRKYHGGILLVLQDFNQLIHSYGRYQADAIRSNCFAKLYFTGQPLETAQELERTLGKYEYEDEKGIKRIKPLLTADEIRIMDVSEALLICGHHKPMKIEMKPYFKNMRLNSCSRIAPPKQGSKVPYESVPLLPIGKKEMSHA